MRREEKKHMEHHETMRHHEKMRHHEAMKHGEAIQHYAQEGKYQNEVDKPSLPTEGKDFNSMGCSDYKSDAMDIAYGQASEAGCKKDGSRIIDQYKDYHWVD